MTSDTPLRPARLTPPCVRLLHAILHVCFALPETVNDGCTARRSEHLKWTKEATRVALLTIVEEVADTCRKEYSNLTPAQWPRARFYSQLCAAVGLLNPQKDANVRSCPLKKSKSLIVGNPGPLLTSPLLKFLSSVHTALFLAV